MSSNKILNIDGVKDIYNFNDYNDNRIELHENFHEYIKNYNVNKNDIETNTRVFILLTFELKKELEILYIEYMNMLRCDDEINMHLSRKQINKSGLNYLNSKYKQLIKTKKYNTISKIKKKYNIKPQTDLFFNPC